MKVSVTVAVIGLAVVLIFLTANELVAGINRIASKQLER